MPRARTTAVRIVGVALTGLALAACTGGSDSGDGAAVASGNPDTCPGDVVDVVVSVPEIPVTSALVSGPPGLSGRR